MRELDEKEVKKVSGGLLVGGAIGAVVGGISAYRNGTSVAAGALQGGVAGLTGGAASLAFKAGNYIFGSILAAQSIAIASS